eukprot:GHUV01038855.1.p1 GENE.GHUV01038855.1~~GHUV01038855.1.p1  ORF type:complete len:310 (+),score=31.03 GHUV01038855.1:601-1530(+)
MEKLSQCLGLCASLSLFTPKQVCVLNCCCQSFQALRGSWLQSKPRVDVDVSTPSALCWLRKNVASIRVLELIRITQQQLWDLLQNARALTDLTVSNSSVPDAVSRLPTLPQQLERLALYNCRRLAHLPILLGTRVKELCLVSCHELVALPELPGTLQHLECYDCPNIRQLPDLPGGLSSLHLNCSSLQVLPELPRSMTALVVESCQGLEQLPRLIHTAITKFSIIHSGMQRIPTLPPVVKSVTAWDMPELQQLPSPLPPNMILLCLAGNTALQQLPVLPLQLTRLDVLDAAVWRQFQKCRNSQTSDTSV